MRFFNYSKPGPGVSKNEQKQNPIPRFFTILGRKYFEMMKLNFLFLLPLGLGLAVSYFFYNVTGIDLFLFLPIIIVTPFISGLTIITRNYALEKHVFLLSDYFDCLKKNGKLFFLHGLVCFFLFLLLSFSLQYYYKNISSGTLYYLGFIICVVVSTFILFSQYYIPVMMVTFDLKLIEIYKNALIFSIMGLLRNLLLTVIFVLLGFALYLMQIMGLTLLLAGLFVVLHLFSFSAYLINSVVYPMIDKTMIQPYQKKEEKEDNTEKLIND